MPRLFIPLFALTLAACGAEEQYPGIGTGLAPCHGEGLAAALDEVCQGFEATPERPVQIRTLTWSGEGCFGMELDGYGRPSVAHWTAPEGPDLAALNPFVSAEAPEEYRRAGAPVAYLAGSRPAAVAVICSDEPLAGDWSVAGQGSAEFETGPVSLTFSGEATGQGTRIVAQDLVADRDLPAEIDWVDLRLTWTIAPMGGGEPVVVGSTSSPVYLVRRRPLEHLPLLHTPVHLACEAAAGLGNDGEIIDAVWDRFASLEVARARDGLPLEYYGRFQRAPGWLRGMLLAGAGQCTTWAHLMHVALGSQGIPSDIMGVFPCSGRGRIFVGQWRFAAGSRFVTTGADGICDSGAAGDDEQVVARGSGRPYTEAVAAASPDLGPVEGDDRLRRDDLNPGDNGLVETPIANHGGGYVPSVPLGFGLPQQRAYHVTSDPYAVVLGGDDIVRRHIESWFVLTGPDGINQTPLQPGLEESGPGVFAVPLGGGSTAINFSVAYPFRDLTLPGARPFPEGDDRVHDGLWVDTGPDGIADTLAEGPDRQVIPLGLGMPDVVCVAPGPDGLLDTIPAGDDELLDISEVLSYADETFLYVKDASMWPLEGLAAQSTDMPPPDYPNHIILRVDGRLYDPSYGTGPFDDHEQWEAASLSACGQIVVDDEEDFLGIAATTEGALSQSYAVLPPD